jgi:hypothetical protein
MLSFIEGQYIEFIRRKIVDSPQQLLYFGFEGERLGGLMAADLHFVVEEYYLASALYRAGPSAAAPPFAVTFRLPRY